MGAQPDRVALAVKSARLLPGRGRLQRDDQRGLIAFTEIPAGVLGERPTCEAVQRNGSRVPVVVRRSWSDS